jgi:hypothetical protein
MENIALQGTMNDLPDVVERWMVRSGARERSRIYNAKICQKANMKMKPDQEKWFAAEAEQFSSVDEPSFVWRVKMKMNPLMWVKGCDTFSDGKGHMNIKLFSLINVVNAKGIKIDEGSLQRYLGEVVWMPHLAESPYITWEQTGDLSARAIMSYKGTEGSGLFYFNEDGDFVRFSAMRYQGNDPASERKEWVLTVDEYKVFEGVKIPSKMKATWMLDAGPWTWLDLEITSMEYNVDVSV